MPEIITILIQDPRGLSINVLARQYGELADIGFDDCNRHAPYVICINLVPVRARLMAQPDLNP